MERLIALLLLASIVCFQGITCLLTDVCIPEHIEAKGDVILSAILKLHEPEGESCGQFLPGSFEMAAGIVWAIEKLNGDTKGSDSFIPGVKLGLKIYDDCGFRMKSSKIALDVIRKMGSSKLAPCPLTDNHTSVIRAGFIGLSPSEPTVEVAGLLRDTDIPFVSAMATLPSLSNKTLYPTFLRTVPSDKDQAKVILRLIKHLGWSYVALVYTDDMYGTQGANEIRKSAKRLRICIALEKTLSPGGTSQRDEARGVIRALVEKLTDTSQNQLGVIYMGHFSQARLLLRTQQEMIRNWKDMHIYWIMPESVGTKLEIPSDITAPLESGGLITVSLKSSVNIEFGEYMREMLQNNNSNVLSSWIKSYVWAKYGCDIGPPVNCNTSFLETREFAKTFNPADRTIDAVYVLARAIMLAHLQICGGKPGICSQLQRRLKSGIVKEVLTVNVNYRTMDSKFVPIQWPTSGRTVSFDANGDLAMDASGAAFDIHTLNRDTGKFVWVGEFVRDNLTLQAELPGFNALGSKPVKSACRRVCQSCITEEEISFSYIPGRVLILGAFSLRQSGDKYSCGEFLADDNPYATFEAFNHAVYEAKKMFPSLDIGALAIDICSSSLTADYILNQILSGKHILIDKGSGGPIDFSKIALVVGARKSGVTLRIADLTTRLQIPQISFASTSAELDNAKRFPYFQRTVPSDNMMLIGLSEMLKMLDFRFVSVVYTRGGFGQSAMEHFLKIAPDYEICVTDPIEISSEHSYGNEMVTVYKKLQQNVAKVVVYLGWKSGAFDLLNALKLEGEDSGFIFFTCGTWANDDSILADGRGEYARGSISLQPDRTDRVKQWRSFKEYLRQRTPSNCLQSRWMAQFWQNHFECNIENGFENTFEKTCNNNLQFPYADLQQLSEHKDAIHVTNAVIAGSIGVKDALVGICGPSAILCDKYFRRVHDVTTFIRNVTLTSTEGKRFSPFKKTGDGNIGYVVYSLQRKAENRREFVERKVGTYDDRGLNIDRKAIKFYNNIGYEIDSISSACDFPGFLCEQCRAVQQVTTSFPVQNCTSTNPSPPGTEYGLVMALGIVILAAMFLGALVILGVCLYRTRRLLQDLKNEIRLSTKDSHHNTRREIRRRGDADGNENNQDDTTSFDGGLTGIQYQNISYLESVEEISQLGRASTDIGFSSDITVDSSTRMSHDQASVGTNRALITAPTATLYRAEGPRQAHEDLYTPVRKTNEYRVPKRRGLTVHVNQPQDSDQDIITDGQTVAHNHAVTSVKTNRSDSGAGTSRDEASMRTTCCGRMTAQMTTLPHSDTPVTKTPKRRVPVNHRTLDSYEDPTINGQIPVQRRSEISNPASTQALASDLRKPMRQPQNIVQGHSHHHTRDQHRRRLTSESTTNQRRLERKADDLSSPEGQRQLLSDLHRQAQMRTTENRHTETRPVKNDAETIC